MGIHHEDEGVMEDGYELIRWCNYFHEPPSERERKEYQCPVWTWWEARTESKELKEFGEVHWENYCDMCPYLEEKMAKAKML